MNQPVEVLNSQDQQFHSSTVLAGSMRTQGCGELSEKFIGQTVRVCGWVNSRRDHGGVVFVDLRDASGLVQVVANPEQESAFAVAETVRSEYTLQVEGTICERPEDTENVDLATGKVELVASSIVVLSKAEFLPFQTNESDIGEALRLKYRYLDLRSHRMQSNLRLRAAMIREIRACLDQAGFTEIETPMLTRSTPEGARDYVVPSRVHTGWFFALPQSPQMFKQLLVMGGFERYYQIARCFRDEDLRADRQPEFTQLDMEMAFVNEEDVITIIEMLFGRLFSSVSGIELPPKFDRIAYHDAMARFGSDRPDLRNPLELVDLTATMKDEEFQVFRRAATMPNGRVAAMKIPNGSQQIARQKIDEYTKFVSEWGAKGLAYIKVNDRDAGREGLQSPILKFLSDTAVEVILNRCECKNGDLVFFGADSMATVNASLGALRERLGRDLNLLADGFHPVWVVDFPLVEFDDNEKRWQALHHPFTSPRPEHLDLLDSDPAQVLSRAYDLVINGVEVGGGSIRNHRDDWQQKVFDLLGLSEDEIRSKFGFLLQALKSGAPPHGGIAFGLDRIAAMLCGEESIRDVIAFPKTQRAYCPLTEAPNEVGDRQLNELELRVKSTAASKTGAELS